jgi:hypothetical protein
VGKFDHVVRFQSSHTPHLSTPNEFSKVLADIGEKAAASGQPNEAT